MAPAGLKKALAALEKYSTIRAESKRTVVSGQCSMVSCRVDKEPIDPARLEGNSVVFGGWFTDAESGAWVPILKDQRFNRRVALHKSTMERSLSDSAEITGQ